MDLLVSCLCWGAGETDQAGPQTHFFVFVTDTHTHTASPISGRVREDKQDMSLKKKFDFDSIGSPFIQVNLYCFFYTRCENT